LVSYCDFSVLLTDSYYSEFSVTANLKNKLSLLLIEEFYWFTAANVAHKIQTPTLFAQTVALHFTQLANATQEANENITDEWKTNALACLTVA
jgi:hypothetical protein